MSQPQSGSRLAHRSRRFDPFFAGEGDIEAARALVDVARSSARAELFVLPGDAHLVVDDSLPIYDAEVTSLVIDRVTEFLDSLDTPA